MTVPATPLDAYEQIGEGQYTWVYRKPGSPCVLQYFKDRPELTPDLLRDEYDYLTSTYSALPNLIPWQRLILPYTNAPLRECVMVKEYIPHGAARSLRLLTPNQLHAHTAAQLDLFLSITRSLLDSAPEARLPDVIDPPMANLVIHATTGDLKLVDTNRLLNTRKLGRYIDAGEPLDLEHAAIHAKFIRRMMFLEVRFRGRTRDDLRGDRVYNQYLSADGFDTLFQTSADLGEPI